MSLFDTIKYPIPELLTWDFIQSLPPEIELKFREWHDGNFRKFRKNDHVWNRNMCKDELKKLIIDYELLDDNISHN